MQPARTIPRPVAGRRRERGNAMIEMIFLAPILLMFLFGVYTAVDVAASAHSAGAAARAATRYATLYEGERDGAFRATVRQYARDAARDLGLRSVGITLADGGRDGHMIVSVTAVVNFVGFPGSVTVRRSSVEAIAAHTAQDVPP